MQEKNQTKTPLIIIITSLLLLLAGILILLLGVFIFVYFGVAALLQSIVYFLIGIFLITTSIGVRGVKKYGLYLHTLLSFFVLVGFIYLLIKLYLFVDIPVDTPEVGLFIFFAGPILIIFLFSTSIYFWLNRKIFK